jgi:SnoaL-like polyketide cyclase
VAAHLLIREYYACFNERRLADAADLFTSDAVLERPLFGTLKNGGEGYLQLTELWVKAFPDSKVRIEHVEQRGDTICEADLILTGTHADDLNLLNHGMFKASGCTVTLRQVEVLEIRARKITYSSVSFDVADLIRQVSGKG